MRYIDIIQHLEDESKALLDIMFNNRLYSVASIFYNNEIYNSLNTASKKGAANIVSWIEKQETKINKVIEKNNSMFVD